MLPATALTTPRRALFNALKDRLTTVSSSGRPAVAEGLSTGVEALDRLLGGGLPTGALVTLEGALSSGRWSIVASILAQVTRRGLGVVIDDGALYPPSLEEAGVRLDRLLVIPGKSPVAIARAVDLVLRSRVARVVIMHAIALRAAVWTRLAGLAHRAGSVLVVVATTAPSEISNVATVRLGCRFHHAVIRGTRGLGALLAGFEITAELRKHKRTMRAGAYGGTSLLARLPAPSGARV